MGNGKFMFLYRQGPSVVMGQGRQGWSKLIRKKAS